MKLPKKYRDKALLAEGRFEPMDRTSVVLEHGLESIRESLKVADKTFGKDKRAHDMLNLAEDALADLYRHLGRLWLKTAGNK